MNYKGLDIQVTKAGRYYVRVLNKSYPTLEKAKIAIRKWEHKQLKRDKPWQDLDKRWYDQ